MQGEEAQVYKMINAGKPYAAHIFREDPLNAAGAIFDVPGFYGGYEQYAAVQAIRKQYPWPWETGWKALRGWRPIIPRRVHVFLS